jgi:hypothetical protein
LEWPRRIRNSLGDRVRDRLPCFRAVHPLVISLQERCAERRAHARFLAARLQERSPSTHVGGRRDA